MDHAFVVAELRFVVSVEQSRGTTAGIGELLWTFYLNLKERKEMGH